MVKQHITVIPPFLYYFAIINGTFADMNPFTIISSKITVFEPEQLKLKTIISIIVEFVAELEDNIDVEIGACEGAGAAA